MQCYLGLGANLLEPENQLREAVKSLQAEQALRVISCSSLYASKPMGPQDQPDYVNAVVSIETELRPLELLDVTQAIEHQAGRVRLKRWGPRTLDIDILLFGANVIESERLVLPHPGLLQREFVLYPLAEIAPGLILSNGKTIEQACQAIPLNQLQKIAPPPAC